MCLMYMELYLSTGPDFEDAWNCGYAIVGLPLVVIIVNVIYIILEMVTSKRIEK